MDWHCSSTYGVPWERITSTAPRISSSVLIPVETIIGSPKAATWCSSSSLVRSAEAIL